MIQRKLAWTLVAASVLTLILAACGDGEEGPTTVPTTITPAATSPIPGTPFPTQPVSGGEFAVIDLATSEPLLTIFASEPVPFREDQPTGDLRHDIPSLAVGDFNDDGIDDLLIGARFGDGPDDSREEAGEAYVIFGSSDLGGSIDLGRGEQDLTIFGANVEISAPDGLGVGVAAGDVNDDG
ncbi:unnamed protein product, partial [marine sediment metagenome]